jgi:hypothetical protein
MKSDKSDVRLHVLGQLKINETRSAASIAEGAGHSKRQVQTTLNHLVKEGYVTKISGEFGNMYAMNGDLHLSDLDTLGVELVLIRNVDEEFTYECDRKCDGCEWNDYCGEEDEEHNED